MEETPKEFFSLFQRLKKRERKKEGYIGEAFKLIFLEFNLLRGKGIKGL